VSHRGDSRLSTALRTKTTGRDVIGPPSANHDGNGVAVRAGRHGPQDAERTRLKRHRFTPNYGIRGCLKLRTRNLNETPNPKSRSLCRIFGNFPRIPQHYEKPGPFQGPSPGLLFHAVVFLPSQPPPRQRLRGESGPDRPLSEETWRPLPLPPPRGEKVKLKMGAILFRARMSPEALSPSPGVLSRTSQS
jgi:hypothetical protein